MVVKRGDPFDAQAPHHHKRNGVAKRIRLGDVVSKQLDGFAMVSVGDLREMEQRVFPEISNDLFLNQSRPGKGCVNLGKNEGGADKVGTLPEERREALACLCMMGLASIAKSDPERRIDKDPVAVHEG